MYSPTTRLLTTLEMLQARGAVSGSDLAARLEVDRRSVRRYIVMLQDLGIPVEATRGPGGGYRLRPGYRLPPLLFTNGEAVALVLGLRALPGLGLRAPEEAVSGALAKLERVLPDESRSRVRALLGQASLGRPVSMLVESRLVELIARGWAERCTMQIRYRGASGEETERAFDPYGVTNRGLAWYTAGYCHLR